MWIRTDLLCQYHCYSDDNGETWSAPILAVYSDYEAMHRNIDMRLWVDNKNHFAEIEYCIGSDFQCKGYATEATKIIIAFGFNKMNLHKVQICTKTINAPSKRVIEKCGFVYEGTLRDYFYMKGEYVGRLYFSILRSEYMQ